jgi:hypothetical protein
MSSSRRRATGSAHPRQQLRHELSDASTAGDSDTFTAAGSPAARSTAHRPPHAACGPSRGGAASSVSELRDRRSRSDTGRCHGIDLAQRHDVNRHEANDHGCVEYASKHRWALLKLAVTSARVLRRDVDSAGFRVRPPGHVNRAAPPAIVATTDGFAVNDGRAPAQRDAGRHGSCGVSEA